MRPAYKLLWVCLVLGGLILGCTGRPTESSSGTGAPAKIDAIMPKRGEKK